MVTVRSVSGMHLHRGRQAGLQLRQQLLDAVDHLDDVGSGLALDVQDDGGALVGPGGQLHVFRAVDHLGHVAQPDRGAVAVGDDQILVILHRLELVVGVDRRGARGAVETALGLVDVGVADGGPDVIQGQPGGGEGAGIRLHAHRGALAAADAHQSHARNLRQFLREPGVDQVLDLGQRDRRGGDAQGDDGRVGRVDLVVDRRGREVGRQEIGGRVDRRLHLLLRHVERQVEAEGQRDHRGPARAGRGHAAEARHLAELAFERRGDRRGDHLRTGAGIQRDDLDRRVINLRQRRNGQHAVGEGARQQDGDHEQRGRDRTENERSGGIHVNGAGWLSSAAAGRPGLPACRQAWPARTPRLRWRRRSG